MKFTAMASALTLALTLSACGGSDSNVGSSGGQRAGALGDWLVTPTPELQGSFKYYGYFELIDDRLDSKVDYDANFLRMTNVQPAAVFNKSVPIAVDTCALRVTTTIPTDAGTIGFPEAPFELVSAGDTYTLTGTAGTYAEIVRSASRFDIAPYPVPDELTLTIPGAVFPGFAGVAVPTLVAVSNFQPSRNQTLSAGTVVSWTPSGVPDNSVYMRTLEFPRSDRVVDLRCRMADDGSFTLPDNIVAHLDETLSPGWALTNVTQTPRPSVLVIQGDALLVINRRTK